METIYFEGLEYKEVRSKTGRIWLDRNLGANRAARSINDAQAYGNYYTSNEIDFPDGYRLPTEEEWEAELKSWESKNTEGAFKSPLKLPVSGYHTNSYGDARYLYFNSSYADLYSSCRAYGCAVRLIKNAKNNLNT